MNSYLITGGNYEQRLKKAKEIISNYQLPTRRCYSATGGPITNCQNHPDVLLVEPGPSISINQIRQLQRFLSRRPYQATTKVAVILQAEKLTLPAQNAFLKTLEEPPAQSAIILCSQSPENLLPTIISRCQIIQLATKIEEIDQFLIAHYLPLITKLLNSRAGERLKLIEPYTKNREKAIKFCEEMTFALRQLLKEVANGKSKEKLPITNYQLLITISSFQQTLNLLNANINVKLCLDNFVLGLPHS